MILLCPHADFGLSINESNSQANTMEVGTPGYCGAAQESFPEYWHTLKAWHQLIVES